VYAGAGRVSEGVSRLQRALTAYESAGIGLLYSRSVCSSAGHICSRTGSRSKEAYLGALRQFFRDVQEWGWIPRRFDPTRALATPRVVKALIGPAPRVIADDVWAKLLWAGLHLEPSDLAPSARARRCYPAKLVRALAVTWLFTGLRSDEIVRLRVGSILPSVRGLEWKAPGTPRTGPDVLADPPTPCYHAGAPDRSGNPCHFKHLQAINRGPAACVTTWSLDDRASFA
jgi:hypothetical protein